MLDAAALDAFLASDALRAADGRVLSWAGPDPGYPYDEATAILGRHRLSRGESAEPFASVVQERLTAGLLGRDGVEYAFDTALALPLVDDPEQLAARVSSLLRDAACRPVTRPGVWSQIRGPHLLKAAAALQPWAPDLAARLADEAVARFRLGARFVVAPGAQATYVHAHCYALEGLYGLGLHDDALHAGVDWLVEQQAPDGSLPAWVGWGTERRPVDVVAQAVRLWAALDRDGYAGPIERGLTWLGRQQLADGGLAYEPGSRHRCSWAAAFAAQAVAWVAQPPEAGALLV
jgi:hypothetical protein